MSKIGRCARAAAWHGQAGAQQSATTREAAVQEDHGPEHEAPGDHEYDEAHDTVDAAHTAYVSGAHRAGRGSHHYGPDRPDR